MKLYDGYFLIMTVLYNPPSSGRLYLHNHVLLKGGNMKDKSTGLGVFNLAHFTHLYHLPGSWRY